MRTLFVNRLDTTDDHRALYQWFVDQGHTPEDVMIVCKAGSRGGCHALVRFPNARAAMMAQEQLDGKDFNHPRGIQLFLSRKELLPPDDPRWEGLWLNWTRNVGRENSASRGGDRANFPRMSPERLTARRIELGYGRLPKSCFSTEVNGSSS
jgi:RNA recognition motif. (a.k.a. RRM, RBD, or RNP domain)